jgi:hypothetical protein
MCYKSHSAPLADTPHRLLADSRTLNFSCAGRNVNDPPGRSIERTCTFHWTLRWTRRGSGVSTLSKQRRAIAPQAPIRAHRRRDCAKVCTHARKTCNPWTIREQPPSVTIGIRCSAGFRRLLKPDPFGTSIAVLSCKSVLRIGLGQSLALFARRRDAGPFARSVPSVPGQIPDSRDPVRSEWSIRQPSRREMQCVPN